MIRSWRDAILADFVPQLAPLTLVADPDSLLSDELVQTALQERGFEIVEYQDPVAFRYFFETVVRPRWEAGERTELVVVLHSETGYLHHLPADLVRNAHQLSFSLSSLFPGMTYHEVALLERGELDALYTAQAMFNPDNLGENSTREFVLRHVFGIDADLVKDEADLLALLLRLHLGKRPLPTLFAERLLQQLQGNGGFPEWPLADLLSDPSVLFAFLQERWPLYLNAQATSGEKQMHDTTLKHDYALQWSGPPLLPFDKPDIRAFVDTLFLEGKLRPVAHSMADKLKQMWVAVGLESDPALDRERRLARLLRQVEVRIPTAESGHREWFSFASTWAEAIVSYHQPLAELGQPVSQQFDNVQTRFDVAFGAWLAQRYKYLATLSPHPPVMVHHIPRSLAREVKPTTQNKVALLVLDGLALDQWLIARDLLVDQLPGFRFRADAVLAWIPTVTTVSRQALFAGKIPLYFPDSISTTAKEADLWSIFWEENGLMPNEIGYLKRLRTIGDLEKVEQLLAHPKKRVLGLVVDQVDHMMHGMTLGLAGLHQQLRLWMQTGFLAALLERLATAGFQIVLTSDHGNVAARGHGRPGEQSLANMKGQRVRIYPNETLREHVQREFPGATPWPTEGLPDSFYPLLAPNRQAFINTEDITVTHGGQSLEEVIVPYVQVEWRRT